MESRNGTPCSICTAPASYHGLKTLCQDCLHAELLPRVDALFLELYHKGLIAEYPLPDLDHKPILQKKGRKSRQVASRSGYLCRNASGKPDGTQS